MNVDIVLATPAHFEDVWALLQEYFEAVQVVVRDTRHSIQNDYIWLAYVDAKPAGCILLRTLRPQAGEIKRLYVRPPFRGLGIAGRLLSALETHALEISFTQLYLDSKADLTEAIRFYQRSGYTPCDRYNDNPQATIFMRKPLLHIREFQSGDEEAFWLLNEAWISKLFKLEDKDVATLKDPRKYVLEPGGRIYFACCGKQAVGCCALIKLQDGSFELAKMGVAEAERGHGVGRLLLEYVVADARRQGIQSLYIETNDRLRNAIHLYESIGFVRIQPPEPSPYQRANVFMELLLT